MDSLSFSIIAESLGNSDTAHNSTINNNRALWLALGSGTRVVEYISGKETEPEHDQTLCVEMKVETVVPLTWWWFEQFHGRN